MATELYANVATTTVSSGGTTAPAGGTSQSWTVASSAPFPAAATGVSQFHVADPAAPSEIMLVTNVAGTTWTVTRGAESTTPVTHSAGFTIWLVVTAADLTAMLVAGNNLSDVTSAATARGNLGLGSAAVVAVPVSIANGGTGAATQQAAMDAIAGAVTSAQYLRGTGTHVQMSAIQSADVPTLNQNTSGTAANVTATLDQVPHPTSAVSLNSQKITSLANGSAAQDAAAFGQLPSSGTPLALGSGGTGLSEASNAALIAALGAAPLASPAFTGNQPTFTTAGGLALTAQGSQASLTSPVSLGTTNPTTLASMSIPANDPVAGAIYRLRCFGYFTTDATSANVTVTLLWGSTSLGQVIVAPQASLTAGTWDLEGVVTFVTASTCNAILTYKHSTAVANGWAANTNQPNSGTSATTVTVSPGQSLIIQATVANNTHVSAWVCVGSVPERVW